MTLKKLTMLLGTSTLLLWSSIASATVLLPGNVVVPELFASMAVATVLASSNTAVSVTGGLNGTYHLAVINPNVVGVGLVFVYQFSTAAGSDAVSRITGDTFAGFDTNVGYLSVLPAVLGAVGFVTPGVTSGSLAPDHATRATNGGVVGFNWDGNPVDAYNGNGAILVIVTNASAYTIGVASVIDGTSQTIQGWRPVPEPGTLLLSGLAGLGLLLARKYRVLKN